MFRQIFTRIEMYGASRVSITKEEFELKYFTSDEMLSEHNIIQQAMKELTKNSIWDRFVDTSARNKERMKKEDLIKKKKKEFVLKFHKDSYGNQKVIKCVPDRKGNLVYKTRIEGKQDLTSVTEDGLFEKLYNYYVSKYGLPVEDENLYLFENVWKAAYKDYCERHPNKAKTCEDHEDSYRRFVNDELANMDIRNADTEYFERYSLEVIKEKHLLLSAYNSMKGVFNFAFKYALGKRALYPEVRYNPVELMQDGDLKELCIDTSSSRTLEDVILSDDEVEAVFEEAERRAKMTQFHGYYLYDYMLKAHSEIGCRPGELVALKWSDIKEDLNGNFYLHIHASQRDNRDGTFSYLPFTKNEKGRSKGGREFPITKNLLDILTDLEERQKELGIVSTEGYIFCNRDGTWKNAKEYESTLARICKKLGIESKGTYTFRHSVNNTLEMSGMNDANKGKAIGNSSTTNRRFYCHAEADYTTQARNALESRVSARSHPGHTQNIIIFPKKKSPETLNF